MIESDSDDENDSWTGARERFRYVRLDLDKLSIVHYPDPHLRAKCQPVREFDDDLAALADRMLTLMRAQAGVGLAAPQVGLLLRMFVMNLTGQDADKPKVLCVKVLSMPNENQ